MRRSEIFYRYLDWPLHVRELTVDERRAAKRAANFAAMIVCGICTTITLWLSNSPLWAFTAGFLSAEAGVYIGRCIVVFRTHRDY